MERTERPAMNGNLRGPPGEIYWIATKSKTALGNVLETVSVRDADVEQLIEASKDLAQRLAVAEQTVSAAINQMIQVSALSAVVAYELDRRKKSIQIVTGRA